MPSPKSLFWKLSSMKIIGFITGHVFKLLKIFLNFEKQPKLPQYTSFEEVLKILVNTLRVLAVQNKMANKMFIFKPEAKSK